MQANSLYQSCYQFMRNSEVKVLISKYCNDSWNVIFDFLAVQLILHSMDPSCEWSLPEGVNLQETVYIVDGYTYQVDLHELPSGIFGILHMPAVQSVQIHDWEVKSAPGGSAYVSHNRYIKVLWNFVCT
jgi:hypothetical protein